MGKIFNRPNENEKRKKLRREMTKAETLLWIRIKDKQICGCKFRRQYSIASYIVDFYCTKVKLAIELDGQTHLTDEEIAYDKHRQQVIETLGIQFLRFWNDEVYDDLFNVLEKIKAKVKELLAYSSK
jgi:very-short-patch-repair endonuclease